MTFSSSTPRFVSTTGRIVHIALWLIGLIGIFLFALQRLLPNAPLAMFSHVLVPFLLIVLVLALGLAFYVPYRFAALIIAVALVAHFSNYWQLFLPRLESDPTSNFKLKVLTFNVWVNNPEDDLSKIAVVALKENPDVIVLQEINPELLANLKVFLNNERDQQFDYTIGDPQTQQAIISKYPLELIGIETQQSRVLKVRLQSEVGPFNIWAIHAYRTNLLGGNNFLSYRDPSQHRTPTEQFGWLAAEAKKITEPLIIAGDFNLPYLAAPMQSMNMQEAHQEAGWLFGFTFPASAQHSRSISIFGDSASLSSPIRLARIDHILYNSKLYALKSTTLDDSAGSDHSPTTAQFVVLK